MITLERTKQWLGNVLHIDWSDVGDQPAPVPAPAPAQPAVELQKAAYVPRAPQFKPVYQPPTAGELDERQFLPGTWWELHWPASEEDNGYPETTRRFYVTDSGKVQRWNPDTKSLDRVDIAPWTVARHLERQFTARQMTRVWNGEQAKLIYIDRRVAGTAVENRLTSVSEYLRDRASMSSADAGECESLSSKRYLAGKAAAFAESAGTVESVLRDLFGVSA